MTDRLIRVTTALAVMAVAVVAGVISYQHAYELVRSHGEAGVTARLVPRKSSSDSCGRTEPAGRPRSGTSKWTTRSTFTLRVARPRRA